MKMSFYVTLPSDSSLKYFPENKISHFTTQLPSPISLNTSYEVGLSEIIYPNSWNNINLNNNLFYYDAGDGNLIEKRIEIGFYENVLEILSAIQILLPKSPNKFNLSYNKSTNLVKINAIKGTSLHLANLSTMLGFHPKTVIQGSMKSDFQADILGPFSFFYIYSDIVSPQIIGNLHAPLLRIVRVKGQNGEMISQYFDRPQYVPVINQSFQTIRIELRMNSGKFVPFQKGKVIVVLHFRPKQIL